MTINCIDSEGKVLYGFTKINPRFRLQQLLEDVDDGEPARLS